MDSTQFKQRIVGAIVLVALGVIFIVASLDKIQSPQDFAQNIANYRLLPHPWINTVAVVLPWLEILVGSLLVVGIWIKSTIIMSNGMLFLFILAIGLALHQGLDISCGCFSTEPAAHKMSRWTLYWNFIWLIWGMIVLAYDNGKYTLPILFSFAGKSKASL